MYRTKTPQRTAYLTKVIGARPEPGHVAVVEGKGWGPLHPRWSGSAPLIVGDKAYGPYSTKYLRAVEDSIEEDRLIAHEDKQGHGSAAVQTKTATDYGDLESPVGIHYVPDDQVPAATRELVQHLAKVYASHLFCTVPQIRFIRRRPDAKGLYHWTTGVLLNLDQLHEDVDFVELVAHEMAHHASAGSASSEWWEQGAESSSHQEAERLAFDYAGAVQRVWEEKAAASSPEQATRYLTDWLRQRIGLFQWRGRYALNTY